TEFQCPLLGVKRTLPKCPSMSAFDPKRTLGPKDCCHAKLRSEPIPLLVNPCCNQRRIWRGPKPWGRQCDAAISLERSLVRQLRGRSRRALSSRQCQSLDTSAVRRLRTEDIF